MKVAFVYARMNPMTIGHMKVIKALENTDADAKLLFLSHTQDNDRNPLSYEEKLSYAKVFLKDSEVKVVRSESKRPTEALEELNDFDDVIFVCGSDRLYLKDVLDMYNGKPDKKGKILYTFNSINVVCSGERNLENNEISNVSGSMARDFVRKDDYESFCKIIPTTNIYILEDLWNDLKKGLKL